MIPRPLLPLLVVIAALAVLAGCKDERETLTGSSNQGGVLDAGDVFAVAFVSATIYEFQNRLVQTCVEMFETGQTFVLLPACGGGTGDARLVIEDPFGAPMSFTIRFTTFRANCLNPLPLTVAGIMFIDFQSMSPLRYTITQPFNQNTAEPEGTTYTLSNDFDNAILDVTTPGQVVFQNNVPIGFEQPYLLCEESNGVVSITGTSRIENRSDGLLIAENLQLTYRYDPQNLVRFDLWPAGTYEYAAHQGISDPPGDAVFDGFGGCTFDYFGRSCVTNLVTFDNPCQGL